MRHAAPQILVIDSDVAHAASCLMLLEREGFDVTCAHDFAAAWSALKQRLPSAILTDSIIDGGDAELVLREAVRREVPTIVMTEIAVGAINEQHMRSLGASRQWEKPLRRADVVQTLRDLLGREYPEPAAAVEPTIERATALAGVEALAPRSDAVAGASANGAALDLRGPQPPAAPHHAETVTRAVAAESGVGAGDVPAATSEVPIAPDDSALTGAYDAVAGGPSGLDAGYGDLSGTDLREGEVAVPQQGDEPTDITLRPETPPSVGAVPREATLDEIAASMASAFQAEQPPSDSHFDGLRDHRSPSSVVLAGALAAETPPPVAEAEMFRVMPAHDRGRIGAPLVGVWLSEGEQQRRTGVLEVVLPNAALSIAMTAGDVSGVRVAGGGDPAVAALRADGVVRPDQWEAIARTRGATCTLAHLVMDGVLPEHEALVAAHVGIARALQPVWFATEGDWAWREGAQDVPESLIAVPPTLLLWGACQHEMSARDVQAFLSSLFGMTLRTAPEEPRVPLTQALRQQWSTLCAAAPAWPQLSEAGKRLLLWAIATGHVRLS